MKTRAGIGLCCSVSFQSANVESEAIPIQPRFGFKSAPRLTGNPPVPLLAFLQWNPEIPAVPECQPDGIPFATTPTQFNVNFHCLSPSNW
jgi:hypothetical protein